MPSTNLAANLPRIDRTGTVESVAGIVVHHIAETDSPRATRIALEREAASFVRQAMRSMDATFAERCLQTARALKTLIDWNAAIERVAPR